MSHVAAALGPVFLLILFGALLRRWDFPGAAFWPNLERLTYYVLFPAMLVAKLAVAEVGDTPLWATLGNVALPMLSTSLLLLVLRRYVASSAAAFTSVFQGSIRFNTYIGLACAAALYGDAGLVVAAISIAILIPLINLLCVLMFQFSLHRGSASASSLLKQLLSNPLILGCLLGIALNLSGIGLPGWSSGVVDLLGSAALPMGLLAVGVALDLKAVRGSGRELVYATLLRFVLMPLLLLLSLQLMPLPNLNAQVLLLFAALPTATSSYILARQLGGDTVLMANLITLQTLLGFVFTSFWILLGGHMLSPA